MTPNILKTRDRLSRMRLCIKRASEQCETCDEWYKRTMAMIDDLDNEITKIEIQVKKTPKDMTEWIR